MLKLAENKLFSPNKSIVWQLSVLHHYSEAKTRDFIEKHEYFSFKVAKHCISQKKTYRRKNAQIGLKQAFSPNKSILTIFCSISLFRSENAWFCWNSEYFSFKFAKRCISQKGLVNAKMSQIGLKQVFFTKQKHCPTQIFVLHHYSEAKTRGFIEIVHILASHSQNAAFHRKDLLTQKCLKLA